MYVKKKSKHPEKIINDQENLPVTVENGVVTKGLSPFPVLGGLSGLFFSGFVLDGSESTYFLIVVILMNLIYYSRPVLKMILDFILVFNKQKYEQSIPKKEANDFELKKKKMELDHDYRMKQLEEKSNNNSGFVGNLPMPPVNVAEDDFKYLN